MSKPISPTVALAESAGQSDRHRPFAVALTGGIASGKTTISDMFEELGASVIDTDVIARSLVKRGSALLAAVKLEFGPETVNESGELRRRYLRNLVFSDEEKRARLERILHPAIWHEAREQLLQSDAPYCIIVVPLLAEIGVPDWIDRVLVIEASETIRLERLKIRDSVNSDEARQAIQVQGTVEARRAIADDILVNVGSVEALRPKVLALHRRYLQMGLGGWNRR